MNAKLTALLNKIGEKEKKDVRCNGKLRELQKKCDAVLFQSDGEFLYINGNILNKGMARQKVECDNCGYVMTWTRNSKFNKQKASPERISQQKFQ